MIVTVDRIPIGYVAYTDNYDGPEDSTNIATGKTIPDALRQLAENLEEGQ